MAENEDYMPPDRWPNEERESAMRPMVYIVTMYAVYDHGCGGVFETREAAEAHARALAADSDGHHDFHIGELPLDEPIWVEGRWLSHDRKRVQKRSPDVTFEPFGTVDNDTDRVGGARHLTTDGGV